MFYKKIPYLRYCYKMTLGILNGLSVCLSFPLSLVCCMGAAAPLHPPPATLSQLTLIGWSYVTTEEIPEAFRYLVPTMVALVNQTGSIFAKIRQTPRNIKE